VSDLSIVRRREIIAALRAGTVPRRGLEQFAVGLERFEDAIDEELGRTAIGEGVFKAVRGDYGSGKTFFSRWIQHRAQQAGFATSEVQISETDTPLHRLETVYRRAMENLQTREWESGAFRILIDKWFFALEEEVLGRPEVDGNDGAAVSQAVGELLERRLAQVSATQPQFAACLRAAYTARVAADTSTEEGLLVSSERLASRARSTISVRAASFVGSLSFSSRRAGRDCSWCSTRWKRSNGSAATCARRA
jgi:P-loop Domain of unknown function (DUF2791)